MLFLSEDQGVVLLIEGLRQGTNEFRKSSREVADEFTEAVQDKQAEGDAVRAFILAMIVFFGTFALGLLLHELLK